MKIPFIDLKEQYKTVKDEINTGLNAVFEKGNFILGQEEKDFEVEFAKYCDSQYASGVNSGTDALYLALCALDIKPGDEVIIPTFTFIATGLCVSYTGAKIVFVDAEDETYNIDPAKLEKLINKNTKAIIPVHIYGQPANMKEICEIAKKHNIAVVEDAAQAHGATYNGKKVGALGDIACFSFYPTKSLGAFGDGGMVVTTRKDIYEKILMLRDYGRQGRYEHKIKGFNSRLDTVQAVVLAAKLKHLDEWNKMRNENGRYYNEQFKDVQEVVQPTLKEDRSHVFQTYAIRIKNRDKVCDELQKQGVSVLIHYPIPLHLQQAYKDLGYKKGDFPMAETLASEVLSLPMFPHIKKEQMDAVVEAVKDKVKGA